MMLKLKLQYFGHLMRRVDSLEKTLMLGGIEGRRKSGWDGWMASSTQWMWVWVNSGSWWLTGRFGVLQFMGLQRVGRDWVTELNWTEVGHSFSSEEQASCNFVAEVTICSDFGAAQIVSFSVVSPSICYEMMGTDAMILVFWMLSFKPTFSLSYFSFIMRLFSSSFSAIRVVSSAYLRLLIFLLVMLIPACASCSLAFHMMYAAYKINKQANNMQPWHTPFPTWNHSVVPCLVLTIASWPAYRFLRWQAGQVVWYSHLFKNFPQFVVIHKVKYFDIEN